MPTFAKIRSAAVLLDPVDPAKVSENNALFVSDQDNKLKTKDNTGSTTEVAAAAALFNKVMENKTGASIPASTPVAKIADGSIVPSDSDSANGQQVIGITLESIDPDSTGQVQLVGANAVNVISGLGFDPGKEIYLSENGGYTDDPDSFTGNDDSIIKIGISDCASGPASSPATDLVLKPEVVIRPAS